MAAKVMLTQVLLVSAMAALAASGPASNDYFYLENVGYYDLHEEPKSFGAAWKTCQDKGGHLLVINSQRELNAIVKLYSYFPHLHYAAWIGVHDLFFEGEYVTTLGYPLSMAGFAGWHTGEPNNHANNEHCISLYTDGTLNDDVCSRELPFFCEA